MNFSISNFCILTGDLSRQMDKVLEENALTIYFRLRLEAGSTLKEFHYSFLSEEDLFSEGFIVHRSNQKVIKFVCL